MDLKTGIYETLIYQSLAKKLQSLPSNYIGLRLDIDAAEAPKLLTNYVSKILSGILSDDHLFEGLEQRINFINRVIEYIEKDFEVLTASDDLIAIKDKLLSAIIDSTGLTDKQLELYNILRPASGFTSSSLFTGSNEGLRMNDEINRDIISSDEIYWIVAFIRFSGVRIFKDALLKFLERPGTKLNVITTSYMGASEPKAVEWLQSLNPDKVKIKVNYDINSDRLHVSHTSLFAIVD